MIGLANVRGAWNRWNGSRLVSAVLARSERLEAASDEELRAAFRTVRFRAAAGGDSNGRGAGRRRSDSLSMLGASTVIREMHRPCGRFDFRQT